MEKEIENEELQEQEAAVNDEETDAEDTEDTSAGDETDGESDEDAEEEDPEKKKKERAERFRNDLIEMAETALITVFFVLLTFTYLLHPVQVQGSSMNHTLYDSDRVVMNTVYGKLEYGDIVIVDNDASYLLDENGNVYKKDITGSNLKECIVKRVIATGGQTLDIDFGTGTVTVDGKVLDEPYIADATTRDQGAFTGQYPITIPEGYCFVMGDNRNNSADSRNDFVGLIKDDQVYGVVVARYFPKDRFTILLDSEKKTPEVYEKINE